MTLKSGTQCSGVTNDMFEWSMAVLLKGSIDQKASALCRMVSGSTADNFKLNDLGIVSGGDWGRI